MPEVYRIAARSSGASRDRGEVAILRERARAERPAVRGQREHRRRGRQRRHRVESIRSADDHPRPGVADEVLELAALVAGVERHVDEPGAQAAEVQRQRVGQLVDLRDHAVAGHAAGRDQHVGDARRPRRELAPGHRAGGNRSVSGQQQARRRCVRRVLLEAREEIGIQVQVLLPAAKVRASCSARSASHASAWRRHSSSVAGPGASAKAPAKAPASSGSAAGSIAPETSVTGTPSARARRATTNGALSSSVCASLRPRRSAPSRRPRARRRGRRDRRRPRRRSGTRRRRAAARSPVRRRRRRRDWRRRRGRSPLRPAPRSGRPARRCARTSSGRTPFCGPKIAVAPRAPVSGLLTSDITVIVAAASRGSSADASTRASAAEAFGRRRDGAPVRVGERESQRGEHAGAAVVGAAAAQSDHESAHAVVEQRRGRARRRRGCRAARRRSPSPRRR